MFNVGDTVKVVAKTTRLLGYVGIVTKIYAVNEVWGQLVEVEFADLAELAILNDMSFNFFDDEIEKVEN